MAKSMEAGPQAPLRLAEIKRGASPVDATPSAALWDIGDGVLALEIATRLNQCDEAVVELLSRTPDRVREGFRAVVIGSDDPRAFSAGATLDVFIEGVERREWRRIEGFLRDGQAALLALRYADFPVVAAVHGLTLGGGCELMLHTDAVVACQDLRIGFPERWIGAVPGWGGVTQTLRRWQARLPASEAARRALEVIAAATIFPAQDAFAAGLLGEGDVVIEDRAALLAAARGRAVALAEGYAPPPPATIAALGSSRRAELEPDLERLSAENAFAEADRNAARALAGILCGGGAELGARLSEDDVMALEREAFLRLIRHPDALERMRHLRSTGRPLRP
ncbi:enoyl-CoA hydratase/isomerase family protein [Phenylobacterium terrae]|uniref:Enoyl-CoA hydratase/isomerase family protein n=1 Tax=Phenylobacterium terrae TaxID=2665495 RepID=A0ABW4N698_9CAUL